MLCSGTPKLCFEDIISKILYQHKSKFYALLLGNGLNHIKCLYFIGMSLLSIRYPELIKTSIRPNYCSACTNSFIGGAIEYGVFLGKGC